MQGVGGLRGSICRRSTQPLQTTAIDLGCHFIHHADVEKKNGWYVFNSEFKLHVLTAFVRRGR